MLLSEQPSLVALIYELNNDLQREHGFEIAEPRESVKTNEGEVFEFALLAARREDGKRSLCPFRFRAFEKFEEAEAKAFAMLVRMSADILVRFIDEQTAAGAAA